MNTIHFKQLHQLQNNQLQQIKIRFQETKDLLGVKAVLLDKSRESLAQTIVEKNKLIQELQHCKIKLIELQQQLSQHEHSYSQLSKNFEEEKAKHTTALKQARDSGRKEMYEEWQLSVTTNSTGLELYVGMGLLHTRLHLITTRFLVESHIMILALTHTHTYLYIHHYF